MSHRSRGHHPLPPPSPPPAGIRRRGRLAVGACQFAGFVPLPFPRGGRATLAVTGAPAQSVGCHCCGVPLGWLPLRAPEAEDGGSAGGVTRYCRAPRPREHLHYLTPGTGTIRTGPAALPAIRISSRPLRLRQAVHHPAGCCRCRLTSPGPPAGWPAAASSGVPGGCGPWPSGGSEGVVIYFPLSVTKKVSMTLLMTDCWCWKHEGEQPTISNHILLVAPLTQVDCS